MFGFGKKKTVNIEEESAKIDSIINYLNTEINIIYSGILKSASENNRTALIQNKELVFKQYGEVGMELLGSCNKQLQSKFMEFVTKKSSNFQNKLHTMVGSSIILLYLRSGATENITVFEQHIVQLLDELNTVYDNQ